jgi:hypothetical protein
MVLTKKQFHPLGENQRQIVATDFRAGNISPLCHLVEICMNTLHLIVVHLKQDDKQTAVPYYDFIEVTSRLKVLVILKEDLPLSLFLRKLL